MALIQSPLPKGGKPTKLKSHEKPVNSWGVRLSRRIARKRVARIRLHAFAAMAKLEAAQRAYNAECAKVAALAKKLGVPFKNEHDEYAEWTPTLFVDIPQVPRLPDDDWVNGAHFVGKLKEPIRPASEPPQGAVPA
jgi:hypothetical protein